MINHLSLVDASSDSTQIKKQVINQWLSGDSRDKIATDNNVGQGTVSV